MKRFLMILLLVSTLCFCLVSCDGADFDILTGNTDITFKVIDGEAVVTKVPNKSIVTEIVIPDEYEGVSVTEKIKCTVLFLCPLHYNAVMRILHELC